MTQTLKHFAARIWFSVLIGGLISLWFLPLVQTHMGLQWALLPVAAVVVLIFWVAGFEPLGDEHYQTPGAGGRCL